MNWYLEVLKKYAVFEGRAHRTEYWMFFLVNILISLAFSILNLDMIGLVYALAILIPCLAVAVRRLHDTNRSGWWLLLLAIPLVGAIVVIVFLVQESQAEANQYGPFVSSAPVMNGSEKSATENSATQAEEVTQEATDEVVINEVPQSKGVVVESHESLEEKN